MLSAEPCGAWRKRNVTPAYGSSRRSRIRMIRESHGDGRRAMQARRRAKRHLSNSALARSLIAPPHRAPVPDITCSQPRLRSRAAAVEWSIILSIIIGGPRNSECDSSQRGDACASSRLEPTTTRRKRGSRDRPVRPHSGVTTTAVP